MKLATKINEKLDPTVDEILESVALGKNPLVFQTEKGADDTINKIVKNWPFLKDVLEILKRGRDYFIVSRDENKLNAALKKAKAVKPPSKARKIISFLDFVNGSRIKYE